MNSALTFGNLIKKTDKYWSSSSRRRKLAWRNKKSPHRHNKFASKVIVYMARAPREAKKLVFKEMLEKIPIWGKMMRKYRKECLRSIVKTNSLKSKFRIWKENQTKSTLSAKVWNRNTANWQIWSIFLQICIFSNDFYLNNLQQIDIWELLKNN